MYTENIQPDPPCRLEFYLTLRGDSPVEDFLGGLPDGARAKVAAWLGRLREEGPGLRRPFADVLEGPIRELRVSFGRLEIRVLYYCEGRSIVATNAFLKKTRKVPWGEIARAKRRRLDWLGNFGEP